MVEFAFVGVLFFILLIGIISFGILLAFKQNMTQAASESARASIAVQDVSSTPTDERKDVALASMEGAMGEFDRECFNTAFCLVAIHECATPANFTTIRNQPRATMVLKDATPAPSDPCLTARMEYENDGSSRILPPFPIISSFEPDFLSSQTTVRLVPVPQVTP